MDIKYVNIANFDLYYTQAHKYIYQDLLYIQYSICLQFTKILFLISQFNIKFPSKYIPAFFPMIYQESLRYYYENFYPYQLIQKWLTYNGKYPLIHRELSFQYDDGAVQRYVTFPSHKQMKSRMLNCENVPRKVDAGAIWTGIPVKDNKSQKTVERQFVFDFDMNDYDDVRTCCSGKKVCVQCWKMLIVAAQILKVSLKDDFGFQKLMYVFSGGRGMHIWVCDDRARLMKDQVRKSSVDYLQVVTANDKASSLLAQGVFRPHFEIKSHDDRHIAREQLLKGMHPHISRSLKIIKKWFEEIFIQQNTLNQQKCRQIIYKILESRNKKLVQRIKERWEKCQQNHHKLWAELCDEIDHYEKTKSGSDYPLKPHEFNRKYRTITFIQQEIMLSFLYPRMDYNVSTMQNHLLKLPFSVHPSSKKISVPLFYHQVLKFNPKQCIQINDLMKELDDLRNDEDSILLKSKDNVQKALKTRLYQYINPLIEFIKEL